MITITSIVGGIVFLILCAIIGYLIYKLIKKKRQDGNADTADLEHQPNKPPVDGVRLG